MTEATQLVGEIKLADAAPSADKSAVRNKDGEEGAVFFSKTIARWVKSNTGEATRTTPAARDLVRQILEQEAGELCRKAFQVARHARGASSGSRKRKVDSVEREGKSNSVVRVMPKDLDLVLSIMETQPSPIEILHSKIEDDPKPKKRVKKTKEGEEEKKDDAPKAEEKKEGEAKTEEKKEEKAEEKKDDATKAEEKKD